MNILFIIKGFPIGGVEVVTICLANKFVSEGHAVHIVSFADFEDIKWRLAKDVKLIILSKPVISIKNITTMRNILFYESIDYIINQWGHISFYCLLLEISRIRLQSKIISVYHNQPGSNAYVLSINNKIKENISNLSKLYLRIKKYCIYIIYAWNMYYVYMHSDKYILLSSNFINAFSEYSNVKDLSKVEIIPNPITISPNQLKKDEKEKKIIYVGRLESKVKHVERILSVWEDVYKNFQEWSLLIIGDGPEKENLEAYCVANNIERVLFTGFCDPEPYYESASILLLTSDYEGFPLVLIEAMSYGVIPVVYNSFLSLKDIVCNNKNGITCEKGKLDNFDKIEMSQKLASLMNNDFRLKILSKNAIDTSKEYSTDIIYEKWIEMFKSS
jgi:glycosyltransferase involved in cell wall biosynthesis